MKNSLPVEHLKSLRVKGLLTKDEVAYMEGDICVAENVLDGTKRVLANISDILNEGSKRILLG